MVRLGIAQVMVAAEAIVPAVEVINSRYENFRFDFKSVIADNASIARSITGGNVRKLENVDLRSLQVAIEQMEK